MNSFLSSTIPNTDGSNKPRKIIVWRDLILCPYLQAKDANISPNRARVIFDECSNMIVPVAFSLKIAAITH